MIGCCVTGSVDGVPEAEERWVTSNLAALLASEHLIQPAPPEYRTTEAYNDQSPPNQQNKNIAIET